MEVCLETGIDNCLDVDLEKSGSLITFSGEELNITALEESDLPLDLIECIRQIKASSKNSLEDKEIVFLDGSLFQKIDSLQERLSEKKDLPKVVENKEHTKKRASSLFDLVKSRPHTKKQPKTTKQTYGAFPALPRQDPKEIAHRKASRNQRDQQRQQNQEKEQDQNPFLPKPKKNVKSFDNIFIDFMALMTRILGQVEAEAHDLYQRVKGRTDQVDTLNALLGKINTTKGTMDWKNNPAGMDLIKKAQDLGVEITQDKNKWTEDEKKLLKENIQMKKDSLEKISQLERTDMQRFLQEAAQCHQARSNVLKLMKEVMDTITHNLKSA